LSYIIFVRHGEADGNVELRFHGHFDSNLTANGHKQAQLTAERLAGEQIDVIYSSDLKRTVATAQYIAAPRGLSVITHPGLREIFGGEWEDTPWEELPLKFPESYENWLKFPHLLKMPGGESMADFQKRIQKTVDEIVAQNIDKHICIVTHGTAIKALVCLWKGIGLDKFPELPWYDNTSITIAEFDGEKYKLLLEGDNSHLGEHSTLAKQDWWKNIRE